MIEGLLPPDTEKGGVFLGSLLDIEKSLPQIYENEITKQGDSWPPYRKHIDLSNVWIYSYKEKIAEIMKEFKDPLVVNLGGGFDIENKFPSLVEGGYYIDVDIKYIEHYELWNNIISYRTYEKNGTMIYHIQMDMLKFLALLKKDVSIYILSLIDNTILESLLYRKFMVQSIVKKMGTGSKLLSVNSFLDDHDIYSSSGFNLGFYTKEDLVNKIDSL